MDYQFIKDLVDAADRLSFEFERLVPVPDMNTAQFELINELNRLIFLARHELKK